MKFKSTILAQASGSLAGSVFSRNANGAYIRNRAIPINSNTTAQKATRALFAAAAANWRNLSATEKQSFIDQAVNYPYVDSLGETKTYTGRQLAAKLNGTLTQNGASPITTCLSPLPDVPITNMLFEIHKGAGEINLTEFEVNIGELTIPTGWQATILATRVAAGVGKKFKRSDYRVIAKNITGTPALPVDYHNEYEAVFGTGWQTEPTGGACIGFAMYLWNETTGQRNTSMYELTAVISA